MKKIVVIKIFLMCVLILSNYISAQSYNLSFSELLGPDGQCKKEESFIAQIQRLYPTEDARLTEGQKQAIVRSQSFANLRVLDLRSQDVDDEFIEAICKNPTFSRIISLDLRDNPRITGDSLQLLLNSYCLGSIRDMQQLSGRYDTPASEVYVQVGGTGITDEDIRWYDEKPKHDFSIYYRDPITGSRPSSIFNDDDRCNAIKLLRVEKGILIPRSIFIYSHRMIYWASSPCKNDFSTCLEEIELSLQALKQTRTCTPVTISFAHNSLDARCINAILALCRRDDYLRSNFLYLDLGHNKLPDECLSYVKELIAICPKLVIDISINQFHSKIVKSELGDLLKSRIIYYVS